MSNGNQQQVLQIAVNTLPFFSRFVIPYDLRWDGTNCMREVLSRGRKFRAFDYRQGETSARALNGQEATERDTILQEAGKTRGGSRYIIMGLSITLDGYPYETTEASHGLLHRIYPGMSTQACNNGSGPICPSVEDMRSLSSMFLQAFLQTHYITIQVDGTKRTLEMGIPAFYPGQGGAKDLISATNGDVFCANYMSIPECIVWNPSGAVDSNMTCEFQCAYDLEMPTWTTPTGTASGLPPDEQHPKIDGAVPSSKGRDWRQGFMLNFHGREESPVSNVS
jgi:hypothetical protein